MISNCLPILSTDEDIWHGTANDDIDWGRTFLDVAPSINHEDRQLLLQTVGRDGINPALLLTAVLYYKNETNSSFKSYVEDASSRLMNNFFTAKTRTNEEKLSQNDAMETLALFVKKDPNEMNEFLSMLKSIQKEVEKFKNPLTEKADEARRIKRGEEGDLILKLPFMTSECWQIGPTHQHQHCSTFNRRNCPKNSLDMAPSLYMGFGHKFTYFQSEGIVVASHSGYLHIYDTCSLEVHSIRHGIRTYYSHIRVKEGIRSGQSVKVGDQLGVIELDAFSSNCNCEVAAGDKECSIGPHLHWELRDGKGEPIDLNNMIISGYQVHTGSESYDVGCNHTENCREGMSLEEIGQSCSTIFLRIEDNKSFCPSIDGANWGKNISLYCIIYIQKLI